MNELFNSISTKKELEEVEGGTEAGNTEGESPVATEE